MDVLQLCFLFFFLFFLRDAGPVTPSGSIVNPEMLFCLRPHCQGVNLLCLLEFAVAMNLLHFYFVFILVLFFLYAVAYVSDEVHTDFVCVLISLM